MVVDQVDEKNYTDVKALANAWLTGAFKYPKQFFLQGLPYKFREGSSNDFSEHVVEGKKAFLIYQTSEEHKEVAQENELEQWIIFIWGSDEHSHIRPYDVRPATPSRFKAMKTRMMEQQFERIGDVVLLKVILPSGTGAIKGKVDTGAEISSLHADQIKVMNGTVKFTNRDLSQNVITVPIAQHQAVKSADGGVENRPVVELDIEINGKAVRRALFNLNNREEMEYPCLIGQNVLEKTHFLVDPKINDPQAKTHTEDVEDEEFEIDYEVLQEEFEDIKPLPHPTNQEKMEELYTSLQEADVTLGDLVRYARTEARQIIDKTEY